MTLAVRDRDPAGFQAPGLEAVRIDARRGLVKPLRLRRAQARLLALARERRVDVVFFAYICVSYFLELHYFGRVWIFTFDADHYGLSIDKDPDFSFGSWSSFFNRDSG